MAAIWAICFQAALAPICRTNIFLRWFANSLSRNEAIYNRLHEILFGRFGPECRRSGECPGEICQSLPFTRRRPVSGRTASLSAAPQQAEITVHGASIFLSPIGPMPLVDAIHCSQSIVD